MFYTFTAVYLTCSSTFKVYAPTEDEARRKARMYASRALCLILRAMED